MKLKEEYRAPGKVISIDKLKDNCMILTASGKAIYLNSRVLHECFESKYFPKDTIKIGSNVVLKPECLGDYKVLRVEDNMYTLERHDGKVFTVTKKAFDTYYESSCE